MSAASVGYLAWVAWTTVTVGAASDMPTASVIDGAVTASRLTADRLVLAAGVGLVALGLGIVIASGATYWYKRRQIRSRLR